MEQQQLLFGNEAAEPHVWIRTAPKATVLLIVFSSSDSTVYRASSDLIHKIQGVSLRVCLADADSSERIVSAIRNLSQDRRVGLLVDVDANYKGDEALLPAFVERFPAWVFGFGGTGEKRYNILKARIRTGLYTFMDKRPSKFRRKTSQAGTVTKHLSGHIEKIVAELAQPH